ncbi:MAG: hypothetical protein HY854_09200 [Burkholderiales bacterium]|nr:hypothetical protein [Burkholderiales bacterium]
MLKQLRRQFMQGPNLWGGQSGLAIELRAEGEARELRWRPRPAVLEDLWRTLRESGAVPLARAATVGNARFPLFALMLATAEAVVRDYCVRPRPGTCSVAEDGVIRLFLPCDEERTGRAAWAVSLVVATQLGALVRGDPQAVLAVAGAYRKARSTAQRAVPLPPDARARVPIAGITGSLGKTTTCHMVAEILGGTGLTVGRSTTQGMWVGHTMVDRGDRAGGGWAARLLQDPTVQAGVFELARGGLLKRGMTLDGVDVGAVLNIEDNHVGIDGITSREDMAGLKRLVVQHARQAAVLNADDPLCLAMRSCVTAPRLWLVSMHPHNAALQAHQAAGGAVAYADEAATLHWFDGGRLVGRLPAADVPATWQGRWRPAIAHSLFAVAIASAMGVPFEASAATLRRFDSTPASNPGRMNFYQGLPHSVLACHIDGPQATAELAAFVKGLEVAGRKSLLVCTAGNRPDEYIFKVAQTFAGAFSRYVCSDWGELRGRPPGEVARLLAQGLREAGVPAEQVVAAATAEEGVRLAYGDLRAGDLVVDNTVSDADRAGWLAARGLAP